MASAKMETSAERYRRIKRERAAQAETFPFTGPSGMEFTLRRPDLYQFIANGTMPAELAVKVAELQQNGADTEQAIQAAMNAKEILQSLKFMGDLVRYCVVSPRIVETPRDGEDEIGFNEIEGDDFYAIVAWAKGGGQGETLDSFPRESE